MSFPRHDIDGQRVPYHRWQKGERCERCALQRRDVTRESLHEHDHARLVTVREYSDDGVTWGAAMRGCRRFG